MHGWHSVHGVSLLVVPAGQYNRVETFPGLSKFAESPRQLQEQSLGPLLKWARAAVPARQHARMPIFLFATAGEEGQHAN